MRNAKQTALQIVKTHFKVLTDQAKIEHIRKEYFELAISHSLITIAFIDKNETNSLFWEDVKYNITHFNPSQLFEF